MKKDNEAWTKYEINVPELRDYNTPGDKALKRPDRFTPFEIKFSTMGNKVTLYLYEYFTQKTVNLGENAFVIPLTTGYSSKAKFGKVRCECKLFDVAGGSKKSKLICFSPDRWNGYAVNAGKARECRHCPVMSNGVGTPRKDRHRRHFFLVTDPANPGQVYLAFLKTRYVESRRLENGQYSEPVDELWNMSIIFGREHGKNQRDSGAQSQIHGVYSIRGKKDDTRKTPYIDLDKIFFSGIIQEDKFDEILAFNEALSVFIEKEDNARIEYAKAIWDKGERFTRQPLPEVAPDDTKEDSTVTPAKVEEKSEAPTTPPPSTSSKKSKKETPAAVDSKSEVESAPVSGDDDLPF